jgi:hypothetical protein
MVLSESYSLQKQSDHNHKTDTNFSSVHFQCRNSTPDAAGGNEVEIEFMFLTVSQDY